MTDEELEKEAEEWIKDHSGLIGSYMFVKYDYESMQKAYLASAEPREKRIAELEMTVGTLRTFSNEQATCIERLEAQIEKMKCCINDLVHLGEFNEHTDEEYFNYQVHEALKNAGQFIKEIKEK